MENLINKKKILVIDDDVNLNTVLVNKLNVSGYDVVGATGGEDGIKKALVFQPDIVLLDVIMPEMDGFEVLKRLRMDPWGKTAKVVMLTSIDQMDSIAKAMESNVAGYLVKTNTGLDDIAAEVKNLLVNTVATPNI